MLHVAPAVRDAVTACIADAVHVASEAAQATEAVLTALEGLHGTPWRRSAIADALLDAGRPVRACPSCGRHFDAGANYAGGRLGAPRGYCSTLCRDTAGRLRAAVITRHRTTWHDLAERHRLEDAGQLDLTGLPLAEVPAPPPPPTARRDETEPLPLEDLR